MFNKKLLLFFLCILVLFSKKSYSYENTHWQNPYRLFAGHTEGNWLDNHVGYTTIGLFSNLRNLETPTLTTFIDARLHVFNQGRLAANTGIGIRYQSLNNPQIFGLNAFYDYREASWNHKFHQAGLGFEYLSPYFDFRLNSYLPVSSSVAHSKTTIFNYEGGYVATAREGRVSYGGADFEIGTWIKRENSSSFFNLYGAIGAYYYAARSHQRNEYGSKARLEARFLRYFAFEFKGGYDDIYHGMAQGTFSVVMPLEVLFNNYRNANYKNDRAIYQPVRRQQIIALSKKKCCMTWNW